MKYSEFKAEVEKMGYTFFENKYEVRILDKGACKLIIIDKTDTHVIDPNNVSYITLSHKDKTELLDLSVKLAKTPLTEREEEKRYYLRFIHPNILGAREPFYLHLHHSESAKDYYDMGTVKAPFGNKLQTIFTESEIAKMDITGFEKEPVE